MSSLLTSAFFLSVLGLLRIGIYQFARYLLFYLYFFIDCTVTVLAIKRVYSRKKLFRYGY